MARPKRMGAYNALDELLPGPPRRLEPVPDPPRPARRRPVGANALDDLLPGPSGLVGADPLPASPAGPPPAGRRPRAAPRPAGAHRHLEVWNPLDALAPAVPARARVSFRLPTDLVEAARDAVAHLAGTADRTTLTGLAERALRAELARLAAVHNRGQPFPPRDA
jgi:hypothetical protein